jgi:hypothetical protein
MTTKTTTTRQANKASERPPTALIDALLAVPTASPPSPRQRTPRKAPALSALPAYREPAGVLSMASQGLM